MAVYSGFFLSFAEGRRLFRAKGGKIFRIKEETFSCEGKMLVGARGQGGSLVVAKCEKEEYL